MQKTLRIKNDIHELSMMNQFLEEAGEELGLPETDVRLSSGLKLLRNWDHAPLS